MCLVLVGGSLVEVSDSRLVASKYKVLKIRCPHRYIITAVAHQLLLTRSKETCEPDRSQGSDVARSDSLAEGSTGNGAGNETKGCHGDFIKKIIVVFSLVLLERAHLQSISRPIFTSQRART
jgi:hypothetical protein